jgi:TetR/AcrR family transcriptional regulator, cholesterol catabolism regulator
VTTARRYGGGLATSDTTAARQERRWESRRELIVRAAVDVFAEMGLEGATLEAVGERVGLTKASLYYYVKSKEELLGHVVGHVVRAQERAVAELTHPGMTPEERLRVFCLGHLRSLFADPAGKVAAQVALSGSTDELVRSVFHDYMGGLDAVLADGVAAGVFRPLDRGVVRNAVLSALNAVTLWYVPGGPRSLDDVGAEICDLVVGGLRAPATPRSEDGR